MGTWPLVGTSPAGAAVAVLPDAESLAVAAATVILAEARRSAGDRGHFSLALSGGSTPKPVYRLLAAAPFAPLMPWQSTEIFWGDERCVDVSDPRSNERMAREALLDHVPISGDQVHPMRCGSPEGGEGPRSEPPGEEDARRVADGYEALIQDSPESLEATGGFDLVLLGLGDNGHTASLFPGSGVLNERERRVAAALEDPETAEATSGTGERLWRVTLTAPFINRAGLVLFVVSGASKAPVVRATLAAEADPHVLPAVLIRPENGRLLWLLDAAAAGRIGAARPSGVGRRPLRGARDLVWRPAGNEAESFDDLSGCEAGPSR